MKTYLYQCASCGITMKGKETAEGTVIASNAPYEGYRTSLCLTCAEAEYKPKR